MDSYRVEVQSSLKIGLADQDAEVGPVPTSGGGRKPEPELDQLSNIIKAFNDQFGNIEWKDADKIRKVIAEEIPAKVSADAAYQNAMKNNDKKTARIEHDAALQRVMIDLIPSYSSSSATTRRLRSGWAIQSLVRPTKGRSDEPRSA